MYASNTLSKLVLLTTFKPNHINRKTAQVIRTNNILAVKVFGIQNVSSGVWVT